MARAMGVQSRENKTKKRAFRGARAEQDNGKYMAYLVYIYTCSFLLDHIAFCSLPALPCQVDIFRDTALRYMGYANEVGEAFR